MDCIAYGAGDCPHTVTTQVDHPTTGTLANTGGDATTPALIGAGFILAGVLMLAVFLHRARPTIHEVPRNRDWDKGTHEVN